MTRIEVHIHEIDNGFVVSMTDIEGPDDNNYEKHVDTFDETIKEVAKWGESVKTREKNLEKELQERLNNFE